MSGAARALFFAVILFFSLASPGFAESARDLAAAANGLYTAGKYREALDLYARAVALDPGSAEIFFDMGNSHFQMEEFEQAREAYGRAALLAGDDAVRSRAHFNLAGTAYREAQAGGAKAARASPVLFNLSVLHYKEALRLDPGLAAEAGRGVEAARLALSALEEKFDRVGGARDMPADQFRSANEARDAVQKKEVDPDSQREGAARQASGTQTGAQGKRGQSPPDARGENSQAAAGRYAKNSPASRQENPSDIIREENDAAGQMRRAFHIDAKSVEKDW